jgi:hypothetical protein
VRDVDVRDVDVRGVRDWTLRWKYPSPILHFYANGTE